MSKERSASAPAGGALDAEVATALRSRLPDVAARTVEAVTAEVADYADTWSGDYGANIAQAVELALAAFLRLAEEPEPVVSAQRLGPVLEAAYALGRGEARSGRTMDALQSAYRVGARVAWEQWSTAALDAGLPARSLIRFASLVFDYIDQLSAASVTGHRDELATTGRVREQYRERLAWALLNSAPDEEMAGHVQRADWRPPRTLTCILAPSAHSSMVRSFVDVTTLSVEGESDGPGPLPDMTIHLVPDVGPRRSVIREHLVGYAWVVGPELVWHEVSGSYARARRTLDLYGPRPEPVDTETCLTELVVSADSDALADLRALALAPLSGLKQETARRLAETLRSWLLHQGRRNDVATHLVVHPQTVRYRMAQIREAYGNLLEDPEFVSGLIVALAATDRMHVGQAIGRRPEGRGSTSPVDGR
jgi:hypothetical protein